MGKMQRTKGAVGEREFGAFAGNALGLPAFKRQLGQARDSGGDVPVPPVLFEVKRRARIAMLRWMEQAERSAHPQGYVPGVAMREDNGRWYVLLPAAAFFEMAKARFRNDVEVAVAG